MSVRVCIYVYVCINTPKNSERGREREYLDLLTFLPFNLFTILSHISDHLDFLDSMCKLDDTVFLFL